jgi:hypothetical protein
MPEATLDKTAPEPIVPVESTDEPEPKRRRKPRQTVEEQTTQAEHDRVEREDKKRESDMEEARKALEALEPTTMAVRWMIGKTPEYGGNEKQYSIYVQDKLPWMQRQRFFALVSRTFSQALKQSGGAVGGMGDIFGAEESGSLIERGRRLTQRDITDASQFMQLAFELVGYSADFLVECYLILLDVPRAEHEWARIRFAEGWDPEREKWGLKDEDNEKIIQTFIDQNYEEIRSFFVVTLPNLGKRIALHERSKDRESKSDQ